MSLLGSAPRPRETWKAVSPRQSKPDASLLGSSESVMIGPIPGTRICPPCVWPPTARSTPARLIDARFFGRWNRQREKYDLGLSATSRCNSLSAIVGQINADNGEFVIGNEERLILQDRVADLAQGTDHRRHVAPAT